MKMIDLTIRALRELAGPTTSITGCVGNERRATRLIRFQAAFHIETFSFNPQSIQLGNVFEITHIVGVWNRFVATIDGARLANVSGMGNKPATQRGQTVSFVRVIRGFAGASLAALGFVVAILLIGTPVALIVRGLYEGLSRLARGGGDISALADALVSVASVAGGVVLAGVFVRLLVAFFDWRRRFRTRLLNRVAADTRRDREEMARAA
jgi:hypothetical protein